MGEILRNIDEDLTRLEESLLDEFWRLRKLESTEAYSSLNPDLKIELNLTLDALNEALENSGRQRHDR